MIDPSRPHGGKQFLLRTLVGVLSGMTEDGIVDMHMRSLACPHCANMVPRDESGNHVVYGITFECEAFKEQVEECRATDTEVG